jgi:hypothetical protein
MRLRIQERRGDDAWFEDVRRDLASFPGILRVQANPVTGSLLVRGRDLALRQIPEVAGDRGWFAVDAPRARRGEARQALRGLATVFMMLAVIQAARGQIMVPALSLAWYAMEILRWEELSEGR